MAELHKTIIGELSKALGKFTWLKKLSPKKNIWGGGAIGYMPTKRGGYIGKTPNYPLTLTSFYPPWQPNSYINLPPLDKLPPHSYTILTHLADQLLHQFNPSEQITPSLVHHFTPLGSPTLTSIYPLWTNYPLTLTPF